MAPRKPKRPVNGSLCASQDDSIPSVILGSLPVLTVKENLVTNATKKLPPFTNSDMKDTQEDFAHATKITSIFFFLFSQMLKLSYFEFLVQVAWFVLWFLATMISHFLFTGQNEVPVTPKGVSRKGQLEEKDEGIKLLAVAHTMVAESEGIKMHVGGSK